MTTLLSARLRFEPFCDAHLDGLHAMNRLPEVMRYVGGQPETREQTAEAIARVQRAWAANGTGWWALVDLASGRIAGGACVQRLRREATLPTDPAELQALPLEIGWRLHPEFQGRGLATEAGARAAAFAFERFAPAELLAVRHPDNLASARVMDRLGMRYRGQETWYGKAVATHVLTRDEWDRARRPG